MKPMPIRYIIGECHGECCDRLLRTEISGEVAIDQSVYEYKAPFEKVPFSSPAYKDIENPLVAQNSPLQPEL